MTDYNFLEPSSPQHGRQSDLLLISAGASLGVLSIISGKQHPTLQAAAEEHADFQAELGLQGHHYWGRRVQELSDALPECEGFKEICAGSWPWNTVEEAAIEMFNSWRQSDGHWQAANGPCDFYGYAMSFNSKKNIWYATGILADLRLRSSTGRAAAL